MLQCLKQQCEVQLPGDENGAVELDPDVLCPEVLGKLDDHICAISSGGYNFHVDVLDEPRLILAQGCDNGTDVE